jgi:transposase
MRKSFHGLCAKVYAHMGSPVDGAYYVFINRARTHVKVLFWDGDGLVIYYKRLEKGSFSLPECNGDKIKLDRRRLTMLLEGIEPLKLKRRYSIK